MRMSRASFDRLAQELGNVVECRNAARNFAAWRNAASRRLEAPTGPADQTSALAAASPQMVKVGLPVINRGARVAQAIGSP